MKYTDLNIQDRQDILRRVQSETGKDLQVIEIDCGLPPSSGRCLNCHTPSPV